MQTYLIGIDIGGTNTKILITDAKLQPLAFRIIDTRLGISLFDFSHDVIAAAESCFCENGIDNGKVLAVGMGIPGLVDFSANKTIYLPLHNWNGIDPCKYIAEHFGCVSVLDNDANINALGEYCFGKGKKYKNIVFITLGTGLGGAVINDGRLLRGRNNASAEFGHICLEAVGGKPCVCGRRGCFQAYCSGTAMTELAEESCRRNPHSRLAMMVRDNNWAVDNSFVTKAASEGDGAALEVLNEIAFYLGTGVATLQKIFNPDAVFIGGGVSNAGDLLLDRARKTVAEELMHPIQSCEMFKASLGMKSGMYGAAVLAAMKSGIDVDVVSEQARLI